MRLISPLILAIVLILTVTPFSVLAQNIYARPSLLDKTKEYAIVLSPHGCSAFIYNNGVDSYRYICWDSDAQIFPDYDGYYRITLYTGFPIDSKPEYAHPQYKHDYAWKEYRKVYTNAQGCLRPYKDGWGIPEALGPCPPAAYSEFGPYIINPYNKREEDRRRNLKPFFNGVHDFISPLLQDQSMIHPTSTATDPNLVSNDDFEALPDLETAPINQF